MQRVLQVVLPAAGLAAIAIVAGCGGGSTPKSAYPQQYEAFRDATNSACKDMFAASNAGNSQGTRSALKRILNTKPPPDLKTRYGYFKDDVERMLVALAAGNKDKADAAIEEIRDGARELGLDECD